MTGGGPDRGTQPPVRLRRRLRRPVPHQGKRSGPTDGQREHNRVVNATRALAERGFSVLETWTIFRRARRRPTLVGQAAPALHVNEQR